MWGTLLWRWQGWWWSSLKTKNQRLNFDRRWVLFLFSKEDRSRGLKINLLKTYEGSHHQTLVNIFIRLFQMKAVVVASVKRHAIVVKIESMILGWESCDVTYGTVVISLVVVCIYIWRLSPDVVLFEYWCHCSAPIPKLKYHENDIWISKVGLLITRLAFLLLRKHCGVYHGTLSKESERGKTRGHDEDSVKKVCETTRASDIYSFI